ncbi:MAG: hypothetical protein M5U34_36070 [Chloroflexi bacterium]|nr:hypothetical protein [Chloroflexota bacterium]
MKKGQLPPNLHFHEPNPLIPFDRLPLRVQEMLGPWPRPDQPLIAGVSGFGFSGTNGHVILEAAATAVSPQRPPFPHQRSLGSPTSFGQDTHCLAPTGTKISDLFAKKRE